MAEGRAASYVVGTDRDLIERSGAIVRGTVIGTYAERLPTGMIRTLAQIAVEEDFRGNLEGTTIRVANWGGRVGLTRMLQSGAPRFSPGEQVVLMLTRDRDGEWTTSDLALGKFTGEEDDHGSRFLVRRGEISGWREDGRTHIERARPHDAFLQFVRDVVAGKSTDESCETDVVVGGPQPAARSPHPGVSPLSTQHSALRTQPLVTQPYSPDQYTFRFGAETVGVRRFGSRLNVAWQLWTADGTPAGINFPAAVSAGSAAWTAAADGVANLSVSSTAATGSTTFEGNTEPRIVSNDPNGVVSGSCCPGAIATTFAYCSGDECDYVSFQGKQFLPITHADIVTNDGIASTVVSQANFNLAIAHELGHTLGIRHSDRTPDDLLFCTPPYHCCLRGNGCSATMNAILINGLVGLQPWDRDAAQCLYRGSCVADPTCIPPDVVPAATNTSIAPFTRTTLTVRADSTRPVRYQWYRGVTDDPSVPVGENLPTYTTDVLASTAYYWVKVTSDCGMTKSETLTVTVKASKVRAVRK